MKCDASAPQAELAQAKVLARIVELGDSKHLMTLDDLPFIIADVLESNDYQHIKLLTCEIQSNLSEQLQSQSHVKLKVRLVQLTMRT